MHGLPYVTPDGRVVVLGPGELPPPGSRPAGPLGGPSQAPAGAPPGAITTSPVGSPQPGPQGAPAAPQGQPPASSPDGLGQLGPDNDSSSAWFAAAAAAAQNMNNPVAALTSGLSALTSKLDEREQARRLIKRQEAMDKLQARRVDIEQQQVDAQAKRWDAEGPYRAAQARHMNAQADQIAQQMQEGTVANLGDGVIMIRKPGEAPQRVVVAPELLSLAQSKVNAERARIALAEGPKWLKGDILYGKDGKSYQSWNNARTGETEFQDTETGNRMKAIPGGVLRPQDTGTGKAAELAAKSQEAAYASAQDHLGRIANYDRAEALIGTAGVGAGWSAQAARSAAEALGMNVGNVNLADKQEMEAILSKMELQVAELMRGQGQITENERTILRNAIPQMKQSPEAFRQVLSVYRKASERQLGSIEAWNQLSREDQSKISGGFTQFNYQYSRDELKRLNAADATAKGTSAGGATAGAPQADPMSPMAPPPAPGENRTKNGTTYKVIGSAATSPQGAPSRPAGIPTPIPDPRRFGPDTVPSEDPPFGRNALGIPLYGPRAGSSLFR